MTLPVSASAYTLGAGLLVAFFPHLASTLGPGVALLVYLTAASTMTAIAVLVHGARHHHRRA